MGAECTRYSSDSNPAGRVISDRTVESPTVSRANLTYFVLKKSEGGLRAVLAAFLGSGQGRSAGKGADLDQVVAECAVPAPDGGSLAAVQPGPVPAVSPLEVADPAFAAGSPLDKGAEAAGMLDGAACGGGPGSARDGDGAYPEGLQFPLGPGLAVPAVGGDRTGCAAGAPRDPADRWRELGSV